MHDWKLANMVLRLLLLMHYNPSLTVKTAAGQVRGQVSSWASVDIQMFCYPTCAAISTSWGSFRYFPSPSFRKSSKLPVKSLEDIIRQKQSICICELS